MQCVAYLHCIDSGVPAHDNLLKTFLEYSTSSMILQVSGTTVRKRQIRVKIDNFMFRMTIEFYRWPGKAIGHLFYDTSSCMHYFKAIC